MVALLLAQQLRRAQAPLLLRGFWVNDGGVAAPQVLGDGRRLAPAVLRSTPRETVVQFIRVECLDWGQEAEGSHVCAQRGHVHTPLRCWTHLKRFQLTLDQHLQTPPFCHLANKKRACRQVLLGSTLSSAPAFWNTPPMLQVTRVSTGEHRCELTWGRGGAQTKERWPQRGIRSCDSPELVPCASASWGCPPSLQPPAPFRDSRAWPIRGEASREGTPTAEAPRSWSLSTPSPSLQTVVSSSAFS